MTSKVDAVELPGRVRIPYVEQGTPSGIPVVLLHGFGESWRSYERVLRHLPDSIHAYAPTQRGHGDADRPAEGYGLPDFTADLAAFLDALGLQTAVVVGHSMGSAVAQRFAIDHPGRVSALVLVGASPSLRGTPEARKFWESALAELTDPIDADLVRGMVEGAVARPVPEAFLEARVRDGRKVPARVMKAAVRSRWRLEGDFEGELGRIEAPTLIVWGRHDPRYPRSEQNALAAAIPDSRLVVYPRAGHAPHWEEPARFAEDLVAFIEGVGL